MLSWQHGRTYFELQGFHIKLNVVWNSMATQWPGAPHIWELTGGRAPQRKCRELGASQFETWSWIDNVKRNLWLSTSMSKQVWDSQKVTLGAISADFRVQEASSDRFLENRSEAAISKICIDRGNTNILTANVKRLVARLRSLPEQGLSNPPAPVKGKPPPSPQELPRAM